jgi:hypothetical protein
MRVRPGGPVVWITGGAVCAPLPKYVTLVL